MKLLTCLLTLVLGASATSAADVFPLLETVRLYHDRPMSASALVAIEHDFETRKEAITRRGGAALKKTDEGYGARFRARYELTNAYVDIYSGVNDGWLNEWHVAPMSLAEALKLAKAVEQALHFTEKIDFAHPTHRDKRTLEYETKGPGCVNGFTFKLDAKGRVVEIDQGGGC